ncbi:MAG: ABC transporter substrate-binding protein [Oscillospiraceae bacterium]|nr:ABC transporter substrate-binding protein [Oscillospiraceae bacterium]
MKRIAVLFLIGLLLLTSCGTTETQPSEQAREGYQILTDCAGRFVEVPLQPQRVAALDSFAGEIMVMIGAGARMVAAPNGVKSDAILQSIYPALDTVAVPMSNASINAETLLSLSPDIVLIKESMYLTDGEKNKLDKLGIPYLVIGYESMEDQLYALDLIGDCLGGDAQTTAGEIYDYYTDTIALATALRAQVEQAEPLRVYHSISEAVRTDGENTLGNDWISCVGAVDVSAGENLTLAESDYFASMEQIYTWDPDVIICNEAETASYLLANEKWAGLGAVQRGDVYNIPVGATRWGHRGSLETYFAILWFGTTFYPDIYAQVDLKTEVFDFYETILGITLDDDMYDAICTGTGIRGKSAGNSGA